MFTIYVDNVNEKQVFFTLKLKINSKLLPFNADETEARKTKAMILENILVIFFNLKQWNDDS